MSSGVPLTGKMDRKSRDYSKWYLAQN